MTIDRQSVRMKVVLRTTDTVCNRSELLSQCFLPGFLIRGKVDFTVKRLKLAQSRTPCWDTANLTPLFLTTAKAGAANLPSTLRPPFNSRQVWGIYLHLKRHAVALGGRTVHPAHSSSEISDRTVMFENLSKGLADARARFLPMIKVRGFLARESMT